MEKYDEERGVGMVLSSCIVRKYPNGDKYEGDWKDGMRNGFGKIAEHIIGTYTIASGGRYEGQWDDDMTSGRGRFFNYHRQILLPQQGQI